MELAASTSKLRHLGVCDFWAREGRLSSCPCASDTRATVANDCSDGLGISQNLHARQRVAAADTVVEEIGLRVDGRDLSRW